MTSPYSINNLRRYSAGILIAFAFTIDCPAQSPVTVQFTMQDGMHSNRIYRLFEDSKGYLWIGTDKGAMRYDGDRFEEILVSGDFSKKIEIYKIIEDELGRIWFIGLNCQLYYLEDQVVKEYEFNSLLQGLNRGLKNFSDIRVENGSAIFSLRGVGSFKIDREGTLHKLNTTKADQFLEYAPDKWFYARSTSVPRTEPVTSIDLRGTDNQSLAHLSIEDAENMTNVRTDIQLRRPVFSLRRTLVSYAHDSVKTLDLKFPINAFDLDEKGNIWVALFNQGIAMVDSQLESWKWVLPRLQNQMVTSIYFDQNEVLWIGTNDNGLYRINDLNTFIYQVGKLNEQRAVEVFNNDKEIIGLFYDGSLIRLGQNNKLEKLDFIQSTDSIDILGVSNAVMDIKSEMIYGVCHANDHVVSYSLREKVSRVSEIPCTIVKLMNSNILCGFQHGILRIGRDELDTLYIHINERPEISPLRKIHDVIGSGGDSLLLAMDAGVFRISLGSTNIDQSEKIFDQRTDNIYQVNDHLFFVNYSFGITSISSKGEEYRLSVDNGLLSNHVTDLSCDSLYYYICTTNGLCVLPKDQLSQPRPIIGYLQSGERINGIALEKDQIWLAAEKGVVNIPKSKIDFAPGEGYIRISNIKSNVDYTIEPSGLINFHQQNNSVNINFEIINTAHHGEFAYEYKLDGSRFDWQEMQEPFLQLIRMQPGTYKLDVRASRKEDNHLYTTSLEFFIPKPLYQKIWAQLLFVSVIGLSVIFYYRSKRKVLKQKFEIEKKIIHLTQNAASARMDPHFIFNSLNSLQYFIVNHQNEKAEEYLNEFSKLMRNNFEYTKQDLVDLPREIEFLESYCRLEQSRLGTFTYFIQNELIRPADRILVPAMLIQPLIENATWHGLRREDENNILRITFRETGLQLLIEVQDNGVGYIHEKENGEAHQDHALDIIEKRIQLYNRLYPGQFQFSVNQVDASNPLYPGTLCSIKIPLNLTSK